MPAVSRSGSFLEAAWRRVAAFYKLLDCEVVFDFVIAKRCVSAVVYLYLPSTRSNNTPKIALWTMLFCFKCGCTFTYVNNRNIIEA